MQFAAFLTAVKTIQKKSTGKHTFCKALVIFFPKSVSEEVLNLISQVYANYLHEQYPKDSPFEYLVTKNYT